MKACCLGLTLFALATMQLSGGEEPKVVSVAELTRIYNSGAEAYDKQFKGKTIILEGDVEFADFKPDFGGQKVLMVEQGNDSVRCLYADDFQGLRIGHKVRIQGTCAAYPLTELRDCKVMKVFADDYPPSKEVRAEIAKLQGVWKVLAIEAKGKKIDKDTVFDKVEIASHELQLHQGNRVMPLGLAVQPGKTPKEFDMHGRIIVPGIYSLEGDVLKLCIPENPNARPLVRPDGFDTATKPIMVLVTKREPAK
jgi:uncharacterized protein (TIGR03067 family)